MFVFFFVLQLLVSPDFLASVPCCRRLDLGSVPTRIFMFFLCFFLRNLIISESTTMCGLTKINILNRRDQFFRSESKWGDRR